MKQAKATQLAVVLGMGLFLAACGGGGGEGVVVPPPAAPAEYAASHMPVGGLMQPSWKKGGSSSLARRIPM